MGCGSSVTRAPVRAPTGVVSVPFHPEMVGSGIDSPDDIIHMRSPTAGPPTTPRAAGVVCSVCGVPEEAIPLQQRNDMFYCDTCNHDSECHTSDDGDMIPPHAMVEAALSHHSKLSVDACISILSRHMRQYPAYMPENDSMEIMDLETQSGRLGTLGMSCEELTMFSDARSNSTRDVSWRSPSETGSGRGSVQHFNRPATPTGVVTSEPSHVSQFFRRTFTSFKARLAFSDDGSPTEAEASPKYLLSPLKEREMVLSDDESLTPRFVASPLSKSLSPRRAATQDAITTFRTERSKDLSHIQRSLFERIRAWSELNIIFLIGTPPTEAAGPSGSRSIVSGLDSPTSAQQSSSRRKPKKLHLSSSTLHTLQSMIGNKGGVSPQPSFVLDPIFALADIIAWYYGTAPLGINSTASASQRDLTDLYPPCLLEHMNHPIYGYTLEHSPDALKCIATSLGRVTREFHAHSCPLDLEITTY
jgi:hypothetical protein